MKKEQICEAIRSSSIEAKQWLLKQPNVKEESITDWLLYDLSKKINYLKYYQFTRNEEGEFSGADWEWWIITNKKSFAARIQAKKLKNKDDNYPLIAYSNKKNLQIELLINDARENGFAPLYAFYTKSEAHLKCGRQIQDEGVYLSSAIEIHNNYIKKPRIKIEESELLKFSNPLSCIFCCPIVQDSDDLISGLENYFLRYFDFKEEEKQNVDGIPGFFEKLPNYIMNLLEQEQIPDWWEKEFGYTIRHIKSIVLFDLREY
jgi:hypothetical protein